MEQEAINFSVDPNDPLYGSQLNDTGITPAGYKILVEIPRPIEETQYEGTLVIPEAAADRYQQASVVAKVLQVGIGCYRSQDKTPGPAWCKPGDYIAMSPYTGTRIKSPLTKAHLRFINEDSFDGTMPSPEYAERG